MKLRPNQAVESMESPNVTERKQYDKRHQTQQIMYEVSMISILLRKGSRISPKNYTNSTDFSEDTIQ
jgi:predicted rRNA methylase YqxC with S4 and FtsJ domains